MLDLADVEAVKALMDKLLRENDGTRPDIFTLGCIEACVRVLRAMNPEASVCNTLDVLLGTLTAIRTTEAARCPRHIAHGSSKLPCEHCGRSWEAHRAVQS